MKKAANALLLVLLSVPVANAQVVKTISGTVVKTVFGGRWSGVVIAVGNKKYGVQTSYEPSAGDQTRGERGSQVRTIGSIEEGHQVQVSYTKMDCSFAYEEGVPCWLTATKIVEIKQPATGISGETWDDFWKACRVAVQARDRKALMNVMVRDFRYDCCDNPDTNNNGDTRDEAFRLWDSPKVHGWQRLNTAIAQGAVPEAAWRSADNGSRNERRVAPPAANRKDFVRYDRIRKEYSGWAAVFELRNGRWYFISFEAPGE